MENNQKSTSKETADSFIKNKVSGRYRKLCQVAGDTLNIVLLHLDDAVCEKLDAFVEAGVAENRKDAAMYFLSEGMKTTKSIFEHIIETEARVEELRQQLRTLKLLESTE